MSKGERAENRGHAGREYWSARAEGILPWGKASKKLTHRKERRDARRESYREAIGAETPQGADEA